MDTRFLMHGQIKNHMILPKLQAIWIITQTLHMRLACPAITCAHSTTLPALLHAANVGFCSGPGPARQPQHIMLIRLNPAFALPPTPMQACICSWPAESAVVVRLRPALALGLLSQPWSGGAGRFQQILQEYDFQGGAPIDKEFFRLHISGRHNPEIARDLWPGWAEPERVAFYEDKEARFRNMAGGVRLRLPHSKWGEGAGWEVWGRVCKVVV